MKKKIINWYYYVERGLDILNTFRNLFLAIFAVYVAMKTTNIMIAIGMFIISIPLLAAAGYYNVHRISKVRDRLNIKFGSHYGIKTFDLQQKTADLLEQINKKLDEKGKKGI